MNSVVDQLQFDPQIVAATGVLTTRAMGGAGQAPEVARPAIVLDDNVAVQIFNGHGSGVYQSARRGLRLTLLVLALVLLSACTGVVTRPMPETIDEQRPVFLLDHGRHASLVLTRPDQSLVRYAHGDWTWYAEGRSGSGPAISALFFPSRSAVGREKLGAIESPDQLERKLRVGIETIYSLSASAARIDALDQELSSWFEQHQDQALLNPGFGLEFVPGSRPYTLFDNSNHVVAGWLQALDIEVRGNPVFGRWRVERP